MFKRMRKSPILLVIPFAVLFAVGFLFSNIQQNETIDVGIAGRQPLPIPKTGLKNSIQLRTLNFCRRVPGDSPACYPYNAGFCCFPKWAKVLCEKGKCVGVEQDGPGKFVETHAAAAGMTPCEWMENPVNYPDPAGHAGFPVNEWCSTKSCTKHEKSFMCWGKPVILLYPEKPTLVDVEVVTSGEIFISDPLYPAGGWKNVLANPDGSLVYQGKPYRELFYESKVDNSGTPPTGLVFKTSELEEKLTKLLYNLGLEYDIPTEIPEFMDFWLPKLQELNSEYIFVSLIPPDVKERNDKVMINPEPDTRIEIIVYFKPLNELIPVEPLKAGSRPVRQGFTMVEWGGTIDQN